MRIRHEPRPRRAVAARTVPAPAAAISPDNLPNVALTPPLLAKILAAEIGLQRQQLSTSYSTYQDLAMRTRDARLARRATEIALTGRAFEQALASAQLWSELDPASSESQQTLETLQLATGKLKDVEPALARRLGEGPRARQARRELPAVAAHARRASRIARKAGRCCSG